jgi:hypothetical protein
MIKSKANESNKSQAGRIKAPKTIYGADGERPASRWKRKIVMPIWRVKYGT